MRVALEHVVDAPIEQVFAVVADITQRPSWVGVALERTKTTDDPIGAGSEYQAVDKMPGRRVEYSQRIETYEPPTRLEESWGGPMAGRSSITFTEAGTATRMSIEAELKVPLPLSLVPPLGRALARSMFKRDLARLNAILAGAD